MWHMDISGARCDFMLKCELKCGVFDNMAV